MASKLSQYGNVQALEAVFRKTQSPATGSVWLALLTATPLDTALTMAAGSITEYTATGYARQVFGPTSATAAEPSVISNTATITFGPFTAGTGYAAIVDAVSGTSANIIACVALTASRTPATGDSLQAAASAFTFSSN